MDELQNAVHDANVHLRGTDNDSKVTSLHALEQHLNESTADADTLPALDQAIAPLKVALKNGNSHVYAAGLSCTLAFFNVLSGEADRCLQSHQHATSKHHHQLDTTIQHAVNTLAPAPGGLMSFLGDAKESIRSTARAALVAAGQASAAMLGADSSKIAPESSALATLDKLIKEHGFASKSGKTREQSMLYTVELRAAFPSLPLRSWMPILVNALEDSDPSVRDTVREGVISIFAAPTVGAAARADLKKELQKKGVRKTTADIVLKRVLGGGGPRSSSGSMVGSPPSGAASLASEGHTNGRRTPSMTGIPPPRPSSRMSIGRSPSSGSLPRPATGGSSAMSRPAAPKGDRLLKQPKNMTQEEILADIEAVAAANAPPPSSGENNVVEVVYVASAKDLENEVANLLPPFDGKETEFNWQDREKAIFRIRGMLKGGVHQQYRSAFLAGMRSLVEGILKAANSLRTTLAAAGCSLLTELAESLRDGLLPIYETLLSGLLKLASLTKRQIAQASQDAVTALLRHCHFHHKTLPLLATTFEQKNTQARAFVAKHALVFVEVQGSLHKEAIEASTGGVALLVSLLKKELGDPNAAVRDAARTTYWLSHDIWPQQMRALLDSIDAPTRKALEKLYTQSQSQAPGLGDRSISASNVPVKGRPSMRELINLKRAATSVGVSLSASVPASASVSAPVKIQTNYHGTPQSTATSNAGKRASMSPSPPTRTTSSPTTVPRARPSSFYGIHMSSSHIPAPHSTSPQSTETSFHSRSAADRRVSQLHQSSFPDQSLTPTRTTFATHTSSTTQAYVPSDPSDSPPLRPPSMNPEVSDIEDSTFNAIPHGLESSEDESSNLLDYRPPQAGDRHASLADFDLSERSRILDGLMDASFDAEVEEAVKGRAEQAEQTANRFLELAEPDDDQFDLADQTVVVAAAELDEDIPVPYTPNGRSYAPDVTDGVRYNSSSKRSTGGRVETPILQRFHSLALQDSPAVAHEDDMKKLPLLSVVQDSWWLAKAELCMTKAPPLKGSHIRRQHIETCIDMLDGPGQTPQAFIELAQLSRASDCRPMANTDTTNQVWSAPLFDRAFSIVRNVLESQQNNDVRFGSLLLMYHLTRYQYPFLEGRETDILSFLFSVTNEPDKTLRAGAEVVALGMLQETEPLYGLSCLRWSMQRLSTKGETKNLATSANQTAAYTMGFKAMAALLKLLPAEVLEEEVVRCRDLLKLGLSSQEAALRQGATTVIVEIHVVIEDDAHLFDLLDGLTRAQINLCTYLFARRKSLA